MPQTASDAKLPKRGGNINYCQADLFPVFRCKETRLNVEIFEVGGQCHGGAHFPLMVSIAFAPGRSAAAEAWETARKRERQRDCKREERGAHVADGPAVAGPNQQAAPQTGPQEAQLTPQRAPPQQQQLPQRPLPLQPLQPPPQHPPQWPQLRPPQHPPHQPTRRRKRQHILSTMAAAAGREGGKQGGGVVGGRLDDGQWRPSLRAPLRSQTRRWWRGRWWAWIGGNDGNWQVGDEW